MVVLVVEVQVVSTTEGVVSVLSSKVVEVELSVSCAPPASQMPNE